jgi:hypothetical protein
MFIYLFIYLFIYCVYIFGLDLDFVTFLYIVWSETM